MQASQNTWYVQVNGQAYGPYNFAQMQGFVTEGRVTEQSIISQTAAHGYNQASQFPQFAQWLGQIVQQQTAMQSTQVLRPMSNVGGGVLARQMQPVTHAPQAVAPNPRPVHQDYVSPHIVAQAAPQTNPQPQQAANTVFIVMAEIRSGQGMQFLQALQNEGAAQRIGDAVWLLKSGVSVEHLRNKLSQTLTGDDRLFLLDSFKNETAWFNIGSNMDARIRELWDMEH